MKIGVFGAGAIGLFFGTALSAAGHDVVFLVRAHSAGKADQIRATLADGTQLRPSSTVRDVVEPEGLAGVDLCIVAVKSDATPSARDALAPVLGPDALTLTLQNGLDNPEQLGERLPNVAAGSVGFNVLRDGQHVTQTLRGGLHLGSHDPRLREITDDLRRVGVTVEVAQDMSNVLAGKLLLNVNNGVCGATGCTIGEMMRSRDARRVFSACVREGWDVLRAAGYTPARLALMGPQTLAWFLRLPNLVVHPLLRFASIDADADTSTTADLRRGRSTEIAHLNGALVRLGRRHGVATPANLVVAEVIAAHEQDVASGRDPQWMPPGSLYARLLARRELLALPS